MLVINPKIKEKKQELKHLEKKYQNLVIKRDELLRLVEDFNNEYNLKFGDLLNKILLLKEENLYKKIELRKLKKEKLLKNDKVLEELNFKKSKLQAKLDKVLLDLKLNSNDMLLQQKVELEIALKEVLSQINFIETEKELFEREIDLKKDEVLEEELNEAKEDKKEFQEELEETHKIENLDDSEKKELKKLYRKLSKLIHPDVVDDDYKDEAQNIMSKLNELYRLNKLTEIQELFLQIQNKNFILISDSLDEEETLQKYIYRMKDKIVEILTEIDEINTNEIFEIIEKKEDYFSNVKNDLNQRLADLQSEKSYLDINIMKYQDF